MGTFESVDEVQNAYERLLKLQTDVRKQLASGEDTDWTLIDERFSDQEDLMEKIEASASADEAFQESRPDRFREIVSSLEELREAITEEIEERKEELDRQLESLDQSMEVLNEYQQDTEGNYYLDETI